MLNLSLLLGVFHRVGTKHVKISLPDEPFVNIKNPDDRKHFSLLEFKIFVTFTTNLFKARVDKTGRWSIIETAARCRKKK